MHGMNGKWRSIITYLGGTLHESIMTPGTEIILITSNIPAKDVRENPEYSIGMLA